MDIRDAITDHGRRSLSEAAAGIGCATSTLGNYLNGKTDAGYDLIKKILIYLKHFPQYRELSGDSIPRRIGPPPPINAEEMREAYGFRPATLPARRVPIVSFARAGADNFNYDDLATHFDDTVLTECKDENAFALFIESDSMEPNFRHGDIVVAAPNQSPQNGDVVVARLHRTGGAILKVYHELGQHRIRLTSYNPVFPPIDYDRSEFRFIYPVVELNRRIRR